MWSRRDSFDRSEMFTRRTATVIISAPDASCARCMTAYEEYFPVPTISRDVKVLPAMVSVSDTVSPWPSALALAPLTAADEVDDLHFIAFTDRRPVERVLPDDDEIVFDGHPAGIDVQPGQQSGDADGRRDFERVAVQFDDHFTAFYMMCRCAERSPPPCSPLRSRRRRPR